MEDRELDMMLTKALKPSYSPDNALNKALVEKLRSKDSDGHSGGNGTDGGNTSTKRRGGVHFTGLVKAAVIAFAILSVGTVGVYAAGFLLKKTEVYDHGISVGNQEYVDDKDFTEPWEEVPETRDETVQGGTNDKWDKKEVVITGGAYKNTYYYYPDYNSAIEDTRIDSLFTELVGEAESVCYVETEEIADESDTKIRYASYELDCLFDLNGKKFSTAQIKSEGVADDAAFLIPINKTTNERTYTSGLGIEFTLVDDAEGTVNGGSESGLRTYVLISYDDENNYIVFENMTDEEIHQVLDAVRIDPAESADENAVTDEQSDNITEASEE